MASVGPRPLPPRTYRGSSSVPMHGYLAGHGLAVLRGRAHGTARRHVRHPAHVRVHGVLQYGPPPPSAPALQLLYFALCNASAGLSRAGELNFYERNPLTCGLWGRSHGRVNAAAAILKIALVAIYTQLSHLSAAPLIAAATTVCALTLLLYWYYLPYHALVMNQVHVCLSAVCLWACLCTVIAQWSASTVRHVLFPACLCARVCASVRVRAHLR